MKPTLQIAFCSKQLPSDAPNGVSCQVHRLANALVEQGAEVTCFSFSPLPENALYKYVKLTYPHSNAFLRKFAPALCFRSIDTRPYDILHYHGDDFFCPGNMRRVRTFYGSAFWEARFAMRPVRFFYQALFYAFEWLSCMRKGTLVGISRVTSLPLPLVRTTIPCGVPLDRYMPGQEKTAAPSIMFVGDLDSRKRGRFLAETFERFVRPKFPGATLTIVGPQKAEGEGIRFIGQPGEKTLVNEYRQSWIYCSVSSYEGFGVPLVEAMACGTAVVAIDNSGAREIITEGADGLLCSDDHLGETLVRLISDKLLRESLIANGLQTSRQYDIVRVAQRYSDIYRECCGEKS
jgi:phosphatidyl-myo-inositol alpha-mannosyltransferase